VAFAPADELKNDFVQTTREGFRIALDVSCYSLIAVSPRAGSADDRWRQYRHADVLRRERVVPHYNVMGVAKAALECSVRLPGLRSWQSRSQGERDLAGPIKTLAARGISGLSDMMKAPLSALRCNGMWM